MGNAAYAQFCFSCAGGELRLLRGDPSKKRERRARAGPLMIAILACRGHNNQPNFGVIDGGGVLGRACDRGGTSGGGVMTSIRPSKYSTKNKREGDGAMTIVAAV